MLTNLDADAWNDSIILQIYEDTVKSHKTKDNKYKRRKTTTNSVKNSESLGVGEPGEWQFVENNSHEKNAEALDQQPIYVSQAARSSLDDSLQQMMNAWFASGYATGRYYTLREIYEGVPPPEGANQAYNLPINSLPAPAPSSPSSNEHLS